MSGCQEIIKNKFSHLAAQPLAGSEVKVKMLSSEDAA
jgi:hypothetical protein